MTMMQLATGGTARRRAGQILGSLALVVLSLAAGAPAARANPNALWEIVNGQCVPHQQAQQGPAPCSTVALAGGYAILKDIRGDFQYLLIPTRRVTGIEDPYVLQPGAPNYFADAWANRYWTEKRLGHRVARQDISLAINSRYGRTQNQLHIHIDCPRPDVVQALARQSAAIGTGWTTITLPPHGDTYQVKRIGGDTLDQTNPILAVAAQSPAIRANMAAETIIVIPDEAAGFYLVSGTTEPARGNFGSASTLQDPGCAIVTP